MAVQESEEEDSTDEDEDGTGRDESDWQAAVGDEAPAPEPVADEGQGGGDQPIGGDAHQLGS
jgi:hypothetical protein